MRKICIFAMLLSVMQVANMAIANAENSAPFIAIVVANNQNMEELNLATIQLNLIYWRKQLYWPKGLRIKPVNLSTEHPLRQQFSQTVLGSAPKTQVDYWNGQYFNGILPPYSVNSEEAVLRYVAQTNGAIGYVDACILDDRVKAVIWLTPNGSILSNKPTLNCSK
jgi:ABC-type phosphate transport system substrate-binding protein